MSRKKSYLEKHSVRSTGISPLQQWKEQNPDLVRVLQFPHHFEDNFLQLPYERQIAMVTLLVDIITDRASVSSPKLINMSSDLMERIHWMTSSYYDEGNSYYPISADEKKLVRMESYGTIDRRRDHTLSPVYKYFMRPENHRKFRLKDYDLHKSPMWRVFRQFESFRGIELPIRRYMFKNRINPDILKVMTVTDFCDIIYRNYAENEHSSFARFLPQGYKNLFVMHFMEKNGDKLEQHLINKGNDPRAARSLCRMMRNHGICDVDSLIVTEIKFTKRVLNDLNKKGYDISKFKYGEKIPEDFIEKVFDDNNELLLLARNKKGQPLSKDKLPHYEVHHKNAVKFSANGGYLAKSNYEENLMLVESKMHSAYYHSLDRIERDSKFEERYFSRINVSSSDLCLIDGFNITEDAIFCDLSNTKNAKKRSAEDKENIVNYYEMELERLNNLKEISDKYGFDYSESDINKEKTSINRILGRPNYIRSDDIKRLSKWLSRAEKRKCPIKKSCLPRKRKSREL